MSRESESESPSPERAAPTEPSAPAQLTSAAGAPEPKVKRNAIDKLMRGAIFVGLGVLMTAPLWCTDEMTRNFQPTTFRAERPEEVDEASAQARLAGILEDVIRKAAGDEMVEEDTVATEMAAILAEDDLGDDESRHAESLKAIGAIVARAAEADGNRGLSSLQEQAIAGQARMMARTLVISLGGRVENADVAIPEGEWVDAAWPLLKGFPYEEGAELPAEVRALDGQNTKAWGYLIALEQNQYLLVQSLWSCCFGAPPEINEAIVVRVSDEMDRNVRQMENQGVQIFGRFEASEAYEEGYVTSLYRLDASHVLPL
ncbi:MAG: hypothetical protein CMN30_17010 [Sandaracinus sp.]|nr:hypothetical protein [Sandaracinus sp.]|tara:strand:+ start:125 stop:1072 length:948 start_codon:yes stop_codon:yes gene_type:complete